MLCPEVLNFETKCSSSSNPVFGSSSDSKEVKKLFDSNCVFDELKFVLPGTLHPPDDLKLFLNCDTEFYGAEEFPFHLLLQQDFLQTFVLKGKLFLQTFVGTNPDENFLTILPSGWLFIGTDKYSVDGLGFEANVVHKTKAGKWIMGLDLVQVCLRDIESKTQRHLTEFFACQKFGGSLGLSSPVIFSWFPNESSVCPSTLAMYISSHGVKVTEVQSEFEIVRFTPMDGKIPRFDFNDEAEFDFAEFENWIGAAFLQLNAQSYIFAENDDDNAVNCKSVLCLGVSGLFSSDSVPEIAQLLSQYLASKTEVPWASVTFKQPISLAKTSALKKNSKNLSYQHQTLLMFRNGKYVSSIIKS